MSLGVLALVLSAAFLHALWNSLVKSSADRKTTMGLIAIGHMVLVAPFAFVLPLPPASTVPFIIGSTVIHWAYYFFLVKAYRFGDLSFAYPIARGASPAMVALIAWGWAGEALSLVSWIGIATVSAGIFMLALGKQVQDRTKALAFATLTATSIAAYTLTDGIGVRLSPNPLSYVVWLFLAEGLVAIYIFFPYIRRPAPPRPRNMHLGILGGVFSGLAYALALYAMTLAPIGAASAVRETSVVIATLIGVVWFRERPMGLRLLASAVVAFGVMAIVSA